MRGPILAAIVGLVFVVGYVVTSYTVVEIQCDGTVPAWMIPDDYDGSGCVQIRPWWEAWLPGNEDHSMVCLGLCL